MRHPLIKRVSFTSFRHCLLNGVVINPYSANVENMVSS